MGQSINFKDLKEFRVPFDEFANFLTMFGAGIWQCLVISILECLGQTMSTETNFPSLAILQIALPYFKESTGKYTRTSVRHHFLIINFFLRTDLDRGAPAGGYLDRRLVGDPFYNRNKAALRALILDDLLNGNRVISLQELIENTGLQFTQNVYLLLSGAVKFALKKYGNKSTSDGSVLTIEGFLDRSKKGSKRYRKILVGAGYRMPNPQIANLRVVTTFFTLIGCEKPEGGKLETLYSLWALNFLPNRVRMFAFQFFNNSLAVGARNAERYRGVGTNEVLSKSNYNYEISPKGGGGEDE